MDAGKRQSASGFNLAGHGGIVGAAGGPQSQER
jgi:hypothetical protein